MAFFKRRPHIPHVRRDDEGAERPYKRQSRNKYDDYASADSPSGKVVYKRPNLNRKSYRDDGGDSGSRRFAGPRDGHSDDQGGSDRPKSFRDNRDRDNYGRRDKDSDKSSGGYGRPKRSDYGQKPFRKDRDEEPAYGPKRASGRSFGPGPKREGRSQDSGSKWEGSGRSHDSGSKWEGSGRSFGSGPKRDGSSRSFGSGPKREGSRSFGPGQKREGRSYGPVPKPTRPNLKASQLLVLRTMVDREIPSSIKRLSEAEDKCLSVSQKLLDHADALANLKLNLTNIVAELSEDSDSRPAFENMAEICDLISQSLNLEASIGDLVGQRLTKVSDFLESSTSILVEIIEEHGGPEPGKKSLRGKPPYEKSESTKTEPGLPKAAKDFAKPKKNVKVITIINPFLDQESQETLVVPSADDSDLLVDEFKYNENDLYSGDSEVDHDDEIKDILKTAKPQKASKKAAKKAAKSEMAGLADLDDLVDLDDLADLEALEAQEAQAKKPKKTAKKAAKAEMAGLADLDDLVDIDDLADLEALEALEAQAKKPKKTAKKAAKAEIADLDELVDLDDLADLETLEAQEALDEKPKKTAKKAAKADQADKAAKAEKPKKAAKAVKKAVKKGELFGPDDEGLDQDEVNELVNKLLK
ncbi:MAG: hypothetical protein LBE80_05625 [Deltaproteobacteria bacterium]|jgi:hypothetical protein|nr:hypothetical protein [Deltaproteobacteria bacterium]